MSSRQFRYWVMGILHIIQHTCTLYKAVNKRIVSDQTWNFTGLSGSAAGCGSAGNPAHVHLHEEEEEEDGMDRDLVRAESPGARAGHTGVEGKCSPPSQPPPPPLHRYPSWERRIYQVASEAGMGPTDQRASLRGSYYGSDVSVPVYAAVQGVSTKTD